MNEAQSVLNVILKMMYYDEFKSSLEFDERHFIEQMSKSSLKHFRLSSLHDRTTILTWESAMGESVACYANDNGFHFSEIVAYKTSTKRMKDRENEAMSEEKMNVVKAEIKELKKIFRSYADDSSEMEKYFK